MSKWDNVIFDGSRKFRLSDVKSDDTGEFSEKSDVADAMKKNITAMIGEQQKLYASGNTALLLVFQAMDAAGKDGVIAHVMSGLNPQGTQVHSFKQPTAEELSHDFLWRANVHLPARGQIGIFNRSYYEEVLVVRVHDLIGNEKIPEKYADHIWERRYRQIRDYERYLVESGVQPVKFFLNVSKGEQKKRLLSRIENESKNWKFSETDIKERRYWDKYMQAFEEAINGTATDYAPWYVIPADRKWYARYLVSAVIAERMLQLKLKFPEIDESQKAVLGKYRALLEKDDG